MNVIIAGASRGIGRALAIRFANSDVKKVLLLARNKELLQTLHIEMESMNPRIEVSVLVFDVGQPDFDGLDQVMEHWASVDLLINNAGILIKKPFEKLTLNDWEESYRINVFGPVQLTRVLIPKLKLSKEAHVVNISSMGGVQGSIKFSELSAYSSSKAALAGLTECLAEELKNYPISINCLALGAVQTEMLESAFPGYNSPITPTQMADFIYDFSVKGGKLFNGKILPVSFSTP
jgi:3-oxoacyl-[acyl-carrier protein] reductase